MFETKTTYGNDGLSAISDLISLTSSFRLRFSKSGLGPNKL